jgi:hypothetical protein
MTMMGKFWATNSTTGNLAPSASGRVPANRY